jgi:hypothetical protein
MSLADLRTQVGAQASVIAHMAKQIAKVYEELCEIYASSSNESFLRMVGRDSADRMELLGNMMNNMDIVTDEDAWVDPIFEEANRLWPQTNKR